MKTFTHKIKNEAVKFWNDEEAQGMLEYILIAVAVVAAVSFGGKKIMAVVTSSSEKLEGKVDAFE